MDEMFVGDDIAVHRITRYLARLGEVVHELVEVCERVRPDVFYRSVWPRFRGQDDLEGRRDGGRDGTGVRTKCWRSRKISLGRVQVSALIHALDMILRLDDDRVHTPTSTSAPVHSAHDSSPPYVNVHAEAPPRLRHISANPRPVRQLVEGKGHPELVNAYNSAVGAVKPFRDLHIRIMAIHIIRPASRERYGVRENSVGHGADASRDAGG